MSTFPGQDQPHDGTQDEPTLDPTAIPASTPFAGAAAPSYGTAPTTPGVPLTAAAPAERRGLSRRTAALLTGLSPFVALILFFVLNNNGISPAWLAFLLIPVTGFVTDQFREDKRDTGR